MLVFFCWSTRYCSACVSILGERFILCCSSWSKKSKSNFKWNLKMWFCIVGLQSTKQPNKQRNKQTNISTTPIKDFLPGGVFHICPLSVMTGGVLHRHDALSFEGRVAGPGTLTSCHSQWNENSGWSHSGAMEPPDPRCNSSFFYISTNQAAVVYRN